VPANRSSSLLRLAQRRRPLLALIILILLLGGGYTARAVQDHSSSMARPTVSGSTTSAGSVMLSSLPAQARETVALIEHGGPFPYAQDGTVYDNLERQLPAHPVGYYHEYTVPTPGSADRGARRIVTGKDGSYWYTGDHYASFQRIDLTG
jgi:ribonuclease T1